MEAQKKLYAIPSPLPFQTPGEEIANSIIHGLGVVLAIGGLTLLTLRANGHLGGRNGGALAITSSLIFTAAMISMFLASTLYHAIQAEGAKRVFRVIDHSAIYLLIAGTYTPFSLLGFRGALGWVYFGIEWALAAAGISLYAANVKFIKKMEVAIYILMGWALIAGAPRLYHAIPRASAVFLAAGGLAYTLGTLWYCRPTRRGAHVVWHIFVFAGAVLHWWAVWFLN
ncbi:MAG: hemolysin III family protein [Treponema sp.]|jgi:hemolysin III|nr:hemolysin III family protein [Treponema sp.]